MPSQTASVDWSALLPAVQLSVRHGSTRGVDYMIDDIDFLIGTMPGCDLRLSPEAASFLCLIARHPGGATLRKLTPTANVLVNGSSASKIELADGDRVQFGKMEVEVRIYSSAPTDAEGPSTVFALKAEANRLAKQRAEQETFAQELKVRAVALADRVRGVEEQTKQYEADVLRLARREGQLDTRDADLQRQADELAEERERLQSESAELERQLLQADELRARLSEDEERLTKQRADQDAAARQLAERTASLEGQQATLTALRSRLERMREELRLREQRVDEQAARQDEREADLARKHDETTQRLSDMESERNQHSLDREQWLQRSAVMDAAVRQLKQAQDQHAAQQQLLEREAADVKEQARQLAERDTVLQGRLAQLAETQERVEADRQNLRDRSVRLVEREQACEALQEQLRRRTDEIAARQQEIGDRLQEYQAKFTELDARRQALDERDRQMQAQAENWQRDLELKADAIRRQHAEALGIEDKYKDQANHLAVERKNHAEDRAQFHLEQQSAVDTLEQRRTELEVLRQEAHALIQQIPDAELRAGAAVESLGQVRAQLRSHLTEIHQYVRQCQEEMTAQRGKLQAELDRLQQQEQTLRQGQEEHRLAMTAFRQQLIDWQGQIADLKRLLARDQTRLDRKTAQAEEREREIAAASDRLARHEEDLQQQERDVADRRLEIDQHLADMRQWYRRKLRDLAGIPLVPDSMPILPFREPEAQARENDTSAAGASPPAASQSDAPDDPAIVPTVRSILSLGSAADQGDQKLGAVLRDLQLIDPDTLTALLAEARRQRRSLRQVLLASGAVTLYQLALIEAGNVQGLMLGPVRVIDRLRNGAHETVYRVFDPRRGVEAVLRHLAEAEMADAVRPDEFRQRFGQAMLNDPHLANTLEVFELQGRPAALQEWLAGLPATDWPPLAAAPGVCHRLLTQAAQGLAVAHQAGLPHGHLSDACLLLTGDGVLKIRGLGEPPWLNGLVHDDEPSVQADLVTLGKIASGWCTPSGVRKGPKTKPLPDALVSVLYRLASSAGPSAQPDLPTETLGYRDAGELLDDLQKAAPAIPPNAEAWDRLLKYVRDHGAAEATLRLSA